MLKQQKGVRCETNKEAAGEAKEKKIPEPTRKTEGQGLDEVTLQKESIMRYHEWIQMELRLQDEEDKMFDAVKRNSHIIRFTSCAECDIIMPTMLALVKESLHHREHFCSEDCYHEWILRNFRQAMEV